MNKYVLRTSLVWMVVLAAIAGVWTYRSHLKNQTQPMTTSMSGDVQPVATGPTSDSTEASLSMPGMSLPQSTEAPLVPVQLTPERMQSIGVKTGMVEYKQLSD